jgi:hypothetical protein
LRGIAKALGGAGLGAMWGEQKAAQMLGEAGFKRIEVKRIEGDIFNNYYVARESDANAWADANMTQL